MAVMERTSDDPVKAATILLIELESKRFKDDIAKAWNWNEILTSHGKKLSEESFNSLTASGAYTHQLF